MRVRGGATIKIERQDFENMKTTKYLLIHVALIVPVPDDFRLNPWEAPKRIKASITDDLGIEIPAQVSPQKIELKEITKSGKKNREIQKKVVQTIL